MRRSEYRNMFESEDSHWWYVSLHDLVVGYVRRPAIKDLRILDAGCGTGGLLMRLNQHGRAEGCDASTYALDFCDDRGVKAFKSDLNTGIFETSGYDVITSIDVLYHRNIGDDRAVLEKMYAALKPGGRLILQAPAYEWLRSRHDEAVHTARRYTRKKIIEMMKACGFSIEKATYRVTLLFVPIALFRLMQKIVSPSREGPASDIRRHSSFINAALYATMKVENSLLKYVSLPFGTSVFAVARKPDVPGNNSVPEAEGHLPQRHGDTEEIRGRKLRDSVSLWLTAFFYSMQVTK